MGMKLWLKFVLISLLIGVPAFIVAPYIWPSTESEAKPSQVQLGLLMSLSFVEALFLGFGIVFLFFGWSALKRIKSPDIRKNAFAIYVSLAWLIISWWPHGNLHQFVGHDLTSIIFVDYIFHLPNMLALLVIVYSLFKIVKKAS